MMATTEEKGFYKRDKLLELEKNAREKWDRLKVFEHDAPADPAELEQKNKFLCTFPYPYMNGRLHLGHSFTLSKGEFSVGYQRLKGKRALFPFGFHCTGMPIKACADKLAREMQLYGNPPVFPAAEETDAQASAKHSKVAAKTGNITYQWQIMQSMGIPDDEIALFADPMHWLQYFPPAAMDDLKMFGLKADWRRSFITTPANPYYDSFVRWQFWTMKERGRLDFGKRHTVFSPKDGQPCMDHDRQTGEGVGPQEYTMIKLLVKEPYRGKLEGLKGKRIYLVCGTLRPETMYGQTNCWVQPEMAYGAFETRDGEVVICTEHCARNMAYQDLTPEFGVYTKLMDLTGMDIMGLPLSAPLTSYETIYSLPMLNIKDNKGTGIVSSVPSDSPDDFAAFRDLKNKAPFREKYGITDEMVLPYEVIPIIRTADYGDVAAEKACDEFKVKSQNDTDALAKAKEVVYKAGFYEGTMLIGEYAGMKVMDAKPKTRQLLIDQGHAVAYWEPEKDVMSRSGDKCVVALCDQWYIKYGEDEWKAEVKRRLEKMECFADETKHNFDKTLDWLHEWACSRSFGLGTKMPWAPEYLIESLSDSTIYMAYYTVAHLLHGGTLDGSGKSPLGIAPEQMTKEVWDFIFLDTDYPQTDIPREHLDVMRREFRYWYPVDLRVSGKDLISNHLTFFLYTHAAIWGEEFFPRAVRANGHLLINSAKMSKSTGNFKTLQEAMREFSTDATRFALADAGDSMEDANFETTTVNSAILRLFQQYEYNKDVLAGVDSMRRGAPSTIHDMVFASAINKSIVQAEQAFEAMMYRDALKTGFYELQAARDFYREVSDVPNGDLLLRFLEVQALLLSPFCPHYCEAVWDLLGKEGSILNARFPVAGEIDAQAMKAAEYFVSTIGDFRLRLKAYVQPKKGKGADKPKRMVIYVTEEFPDWQAETLKLLERLHIEDRAAYEDNKGILNRLKDVACVQPHMKKLMSFVQFCKNEEKAHGPSALSSTIPLNEKEVLANYIPYMRKTLDLEEVLICDAKEADEKVRQGCQPMHPVVAFSS